jgi:hypothetical protein
MAVLSDGGLSSLRLSPEVVAQRLDILDEPVEPIRHGIFWCLRCACAAIIQQDEPSRLRLARQQVHGGEQAGPASPAGTEIPWAGQGPVVRGAGGHHPRVRARCKRLVQ